MFKESFLKRIISSKPLSYLLILLLFFALVSLTREINRQFFLRKELNYLKTQAISLEEENKMLLEDLEKIKTDYYWERAARVQLGLKKPGEEIVIIVSEEPDSSERNLKYFGEKLSNFKTWWNHFFDNKKFEKEKNHKKTK